jgi:hypothetical protein
MYEEMTGGVIFMRRDAEPVRRRGLDDANLDSDGGAGTTASAARKIRARRGTASATSWITGGGQAGAPAGRACR